MFGMYNSTFIFSLSKKEAKRLWQIIRFAYLSGSRHFFNQPYF